MVKRQLVGAVAQRGGTVLTIVFATPYAVPRLVRVYLFSALTANHGISMCRKKKFYLPRYTGLENRMMSTDISALVTPLIRDACPMERGRTALSRSHASMRMPPTVL